MLMQSWLLEMHNFAEEPMSTSQLVFVSRALRALALGALIVVSQCLAAPAAQAKPQTQSQSQSPQQAALHFYRWYMQSLVLSQNPLQQSPVQMSAYVDSKLMNELKRRMSRKGLHADYFFQAQDFMEDWTTDIRAVPFPVRGNLASVVVILGATPETKRMLALTLTKGDGDWKICMVRLV
jgi:hypothetical protein